MENRNEIAKKVNSKLEEIHQLTTLEQLLERNVFEFTVKSKKYRVRKPSQRERLEVHEQRTIKYTEMLKDDTFMFRDQLVELYKKKGKDINKMDSTLIVIQKQHDDLLLRINECQNDEDRKKMEEEIIDMRTEQAEIIAQKADLLQYCIEERIKDFINSYYMYLLLETQKDGNWEKVFKTYDDFLDSDTLDDDKEELLVRAVYYMSLLWNNRTNEI